MWKLKTVIGGLVLSVLVAASSAMAIAPNIPLRGDFAITTSAGCVNVWVANAGMPGFTQDLRAIGNPYTASFNMQGVWTFRGDGTGASKERSTHIVSDGAGASKDIVGLFTYGHLLDGTLYVEHGTAIGHIPVGIFVGQLNRLSNRPPSAGALSADRNSFVLGTSFPGEETYERLSEDGSMVLGVTKRICQRTTTGVRIINQQ